MGMGLRLEALSARRGEFQLGPIDLTVPDGSCLAVQGVNGAGKTTLLEAVAGFTTVGSGRVILHGRDITAQPPERRRIAYVPQDLALFPHLSVERNLAFGLRGGRTANRGLLERLLDDFRLGRLRARYPHQLSRGQRQRVALARALAMEPALVLFDEPAANLDAGSRHSLHAGVRQLLAEHNLAVLYVTHDQLEAAALADHIAILANGRLLQVGSYGDVLAQPADSRVAAHLGVDNLWPARVIGASPRGLRLEVAGMGLETTRTVAPQGPLHAGLCAGEIELSRSQPQREENCLQVTVAAIHGGGPLLLLHLDGPPRMHAWVPGWWARELAVGARLWAWLPPENVRLVPQAEAEP